MKIQTCAELSACSTECGQPVGKGIKRTYQEGPSSANSTALYVANSLPSSTVAQPPQRPAAKVRPQLAVVTESPQTQQEAQYYPYTSIPMAGWLHPCRVCRQWTANSVQLSSTAADISCCRRCEPELMRLEYQLGAQARSPGKKADTQEATSLSPSSRSTHSPVLAQSCGIQTRESSIAQTPNSRQPSSRGNTHKQQVVRSLFGAAMLPPRAPGSGKGTDFSAVWEHINSMPKPLQQQVLAHAWSGGVSGGSGSDTLSPMTGGAGVLSQHICRDSSDSQPL